MDRLNEIKRHYFGRVLSYRRACEGIGQLSQSSSLYAWLILADLRDEHRQRLWMPVFRLFVPLLLLAIYVVLWQVVGHLLVSWYPQVDPSVLQLEAELGRREGSSVCSARSCSCSISGTRASA